MNYNIKVEPNAKPVTLAEIPDGSLAIVLDGEFKGELFFKNVSGLHSISRNRYWESDYIANGTRRKGFYVGPITAACHVIVAGDVLKIEEVK